MSPPAKKREEKPEKKPESKAEKRKREKEVEDAKKPKKPRKKSSAEISKEKIKTSRANTSTHTHHFCTVDRKHYFIFCCRRRACSFEIEEAECGADTVGGVAGRASSAK